MQGAKRRGRHLLELRSAQMNEIQLALKNAVGDIRITYGLRWMYWSDESHKWEVREHPPYQRGTVLIISTDSEQDAVDKLMEE
jgi:hypothetical protein